MSLAPYIRHLGRGPGRARNLTRDEAREAMTLIASGQAEPEGIGAFLMLLRYRGETPPEIAGFTEAFRPTLANWHGIGAAIDWPSYAAGRSRGAPLFLLSAKLVARAGYPVFLHGYNGASKAIRSALGPLDIPLCQTPEAARTALLKTSIAYAPLEAIAPRVHELLKLRDILGLRSCLNTVARMLNPSAAALTLQGVFHPSYSDLQMQAAALLGQLGLAVIKGGGGEFERHPEKPVSVHAMQGGTPVTRRYTPRLIGHHRLNIAKADPAALWAGTVEDPFAEAVVTGTAALVFDQLGTADGQARAEALWRNRHLANAA